MKRPVKSLLSLLLIISLLMSNFAMIISFAAIENYPVELAFNNIFVLDNWSKNKSSTTIAAEGGQNKTDKLDINLNNGTIVFKNPYSGEAYTGFSMETVDANLIGNRMHYNMDVEPNTTYTFSFNATFTTGGIQPYVFYFDEDYRYISLKEQYFNDNGAKSFEFTTPENCRYIQIRFTVANTGTATFSNIFISKKYAGAATDTNYDHRRVYTYSKSNPTTYGANGALPVPTDVPAGYVFAGWYTEANGTGERITENTVVKHSSFSVYPKYEPIIDSLSIKTNAAKTTYSLGERVNLTGLVLEAKVGTTTYTIDSGFYCTPEYLTSTGTQTVTVHYGGKTATYTVNVGYNVPDSIVFNGSQVDITIENNLYQINQMASAPFNHYSLTYYSESYVKGIIKYEDSSTEEFFLEPSSNFDREDSNGEFSSYVDGYLTKVLKSQHDIDKVTSKLHSGIQTISFELLDNKAGSFEILSLETSLSEYLADENGEITGDAIMGQTLKLFKNDKYQVGIDVLNGGVVAHLSVIDSNIEARVYNINGQDVTKVDYADKLDAAYGTNYKSKSTEVNLINYYDTGRYLQQSYYGTNEKPYETGSYNGNDQWNYNPVQGGNVVGESSKVIDYEIGTDYIYVKTRPLDWAKWSDDFANKVSDDDYEPKYGNDEYITDTYVESKYVFEDGMIRVYNRMVDYSGLPSAVTTQELPAFYTIEPLNQYVRTNVDTEEDAWTFNAELEYFSEPEFWGVTGDYVTNNYPNGFSIDTNTPEHWGAFMASQDKDSFGIGIYSPESTNLCYGVYPAINSGLPSRHADTINPAYEDNTSYIAPIGTRTFESYSPSEYSYYISTGTANQIRNSFGVVDDEGYAEELEAQKTVGSISVPETIYMTPSTGASTTAQYYVNNIIDVNGNVTLEQSNADTTGYVAIYSPGMVGFKYSVSINGDDNAISFGFENMDLTTEVMVAQNCGDMKGYIFYDPVNLEYLASGLTAGSTATAEWKFTLTYADGSTRTHYAYTTLYAPWYLPVGAATRAQTGSNGKKVYDQSIAWISGVHGYTANSNGSYWIAATNQTLSDEGEYSGKGTYYANTNMLPLISGVGTSSGTGSAVLDWLSSSAVSGVSQPTIRYFNLTADKSKYGCLVADISPVANITVDTSRYTNFNQIPNLTVGYNITDIDNSKGVIWYVSDFTSIAHSKQANSDGIKFYNYTKQDSSSNISNKANGEWFDNGAQGSIIYGSATTNSGSSYTGVSGGVEYNAAWNRSIVTGSTTYDYMLKAAAHAHSNSDARAYSINFVQLRAANVNKATLRDLVLEASSLNEANYTKASWSAMKTALQNAAAELGNPTDSDVATATTNLKNAMNALQTTVTFNANGGNNINPNASFNVTVGTNLVPEYDLSAYSVTNAPAGYHFAGWATTADATEGSTSIKTGLKPTFYAVWAENSYTVKFDPNDGVGSVANKTVTYTENFTLPSSGFSRPGYTFLGWSTTAVQPSAFATAPEFKPGASVSKLATSGEIVLYAVWSENSYTVKFDANSGTGSINDVTTKYTATIKLPTSGFSKAGYTLLGWATDKNATSATYTPGASVSKLATSGEITLYAVWAENSYTVKFDANGGTGSIADKTVKYADSFNLPADGFTREGYTFLGWSTDKNATYATYTPGASASELSTENNGTVTLYAIWEEIVVNAADDTVVIEYGLPVKINVLKNDTNAANVTAIGTSAPNTGSVKNTTRAFTGKSLSFASGNVTLENGVITYTPTTTDASAQEFYYEVTAYGNYYYAKVTVIPATSIYYEETFFGYQNAQINGNDYNWQNDGSVAFDVVQNGDTIGELNNAYGYDAAYDNCTTYSGNNVSYVTVDENVNSTNGPVATFTFTGTGFDLFTVTDYESGMVTATIYDSNGARVKGILANAYFGYTYLDGEYHPNDNGALYQVPIIKARDLDYGTYTVEIRPRYNKSFDFASRGDCKVYVDAVRIYDPMGANNEIANDAYKADGEYKPQYLNLRDTFSSAPVDKVFGKDCSVYIDGNGSVTIEEYWSSGPKNEVYLAKGDAIAFNIVVESSRVVPATIQLGMRITGKGGTSADVKLLNADDNANAWKQEITLNSATERFYSIQPVVDWIVTDNGKLMTSSPIVITNTSDAIISLTSLKWAFNEDYDAEPVMYVMTDENTPRMAMFAIRRAVQTEAQQTILNPENITFGFSTDAYTVGDAGMLTVVTEQGVAAVTVNGEDAIGNGVDENDKMIWTYEFFADEAGTMEFEIVAADENGFTSESVYASINVKDVVEETPETPEETPEIPEETPVVPDDDVVDDTTDDSANSSESKKPFAFLSDFIKNIINILKTILTILMGGKTA